MATLKTANSPSRPVSSVFWGRLAARQLSEMLASNIKIPCPLSATATRNRHAKWTSPLYRENTGTTSLRPSFPRSSMYVVCNRGCKLICHMPHVYNSVSSAALPLDARLVTSRNLVWTISRARFPNNRGLFFLVYFKHVRFCQRAEVSTRFFFFFATAAVHSTQQCQG